MSLKLDYLNYFLVTDSVGLSSTTLL